MTEKEQIQILWKTIDQLHTAAMEVKNPELLRKYIKRKAVHAHRKVGYPGEPPGGDFDESEIDDDENA